MSETLLIQLIEDFGSFLEGIESFIVSMLPGLISIFTVLFIASLIGVIVYIILRAKEWARYQQNG